MKTILVVDDEEIARTLTSEILEDEYNVYTADSPNKAYELLRKIHPDCILLDLYMPDEDGLSMITTLSIHPAWANIPVIFITSETDNDIEVICIESGAVDYIRKPFSPAVLKARVSRVIAAREAAAKEISGSDAVKATVSYLSDKIHDGAVFFKSKDIAKALGLSSRIVARCINDIAENDGRFDVSVWGKSNVSVWKITLNEQELPKNHEK